MFGDPTFNDYYRKALEEAGRAIIHESESAILSSEVDEISNSIFHRFALMPLQFDPATLSYEIKKEVRRVPAHMREGPYQYSGDTEWEFEIAVISIPIERNPNLDWIKKLGTGTWTSDGFEDRIVYDQNEISFSFDTKWYGSRMGEEQVVNEINLKSERLMQVLEAKNSQIKSENENFTRAIKTVIEQRKAQLTADKEKLGVLSQKIKIPIKQKVTTAVQVEEPVRAISAPRKNNSAASRSRNFDVFICHASEDKESFVEPLAQALRNAGLTVWYDDFQLEWGDGLRQSIERGLAGSNYGIVVLSKPFLGKKKWTEHELDGLFAMETKGKKVILPIWHNVTRDDVLEYSPPLADRLAKKSEQDDIPAIVSELQKLLRKNKTLPA